VYLQEEKKYSVTFESRRIKTVLKLEASLGNAAVREDITLYWGTDLAGDN
jgi:hypothetical protein